MQEVETAVGEGHHLSLPLEVPAHRAAASQSTTLWLVLYVLMIISKIYNDIFMRRI